MQGPRNELHDKKFWKQRVQGQRSLAGAPFLEVLHGLSVESVAGLCSSGTPHPGLSSVQIPQGMAGRSLVVGVVPPGRLALLLARCDHAGVELQPRQQRFH